MAAAARYRTLRRTVASSRWGLLAVSLPSSALDNAVALGRLREHVPVRVTFIPQWVRLHR
jgi:hypothetical protein